MFILPRRVLAETRGCGSSALLSRLGAMRRIAAVGAELRERRRTVCEVLSANGLVSSWQAIVAVTPILGIEDKAAFATSRRRAHNAAKERAISWESSPCECLDSSR